MANDGNFNFFLSQFSYLTCNRIIFGKNVSNEKIHFENYSLIKTSLIFR